MRRPPNDQKCPAADRESLLASPATRKDFCKHRADYCCERVKLKKLWVKKLNPNALMILTAIDLSHKAVRPSLISSSQITSSNIDIVHA